jgi:hypothetical protein
LTVPGLRRVLLTLALATLLAPAAARAQDPSGWAMPRGDLPGWRQVYANSFSAPLELGAWPTADLPALRAYPRPWTDTFGTGVHDPQRTVSIAGGVLDVFLHDEVVDGRREKLVAAIEPKVDGVVLNTLYGRVSVRARADALPNYYAAWLLWPRTGRCAGQGEIDFAEGRLDGTVRAFLHNDDSASCSEQQACGSLGVTFAGWHTYTTVWEPGRLRVYVDSVLRCVKTAHVPDAPFHVVLATETGGSAVMGRGGHARFDWLTVYVPA